MVMMMMIVAMTMAVMMVINNDDHGGDEDLIDEPSTVIGETKLTELPFPGNIIIFVVIQVGRL